MINDTQKAAAFKAAAFLAFIGFYRKTPGRLRKTALRGDAHAGQRKAAAFPSYLHEQNENAILSPSMHKGQLCAKRGVSV